MFWEAPQIKANLGKVLCSSPNTENKTKHKPEERRERKEEKKEGKEGKIDTKIA